MPLILNWDCVDCGIFHRIWTLNPFGPFKVHYMEKNPWMFSSETFIYFRLKKETMNILDDMGASKLSGNF